MSSNNSGSSGIGISELLGVLFVGLKLGGVIGWSWWWVTAPFWGGPALLISSVVGWMGVFATRDAIRAWKGKRRLR